MYNGFPFDKDTFICNWRCYRENNWAGKGICTKSSSKKLFLLINHFPFKTYFFLLWDEWLKFEINICLLSEAMYCFSWHKMLFKKREILLWYCLTNELKINVNYCSENILKPHHCCILISCQLPKRQLLFYTLYKNKRQ